MKNKFIVLLCLASGLLTGYLIYSYLKGVEQSLSNIEYGEVIVAAIDIPAKTEIRNEMLATKKIPLEYIHSQAVREKDDLIGSITLSPLLKGEIFLNGKVVQKGKVEQGLAYKIPAGKRAVTLAVNEVSGIAGLIRPGDHLDIAATVSIPEGEREIPYTLIVLQDIEVLAVGRTMTEKDVPETKTVTLAVTVEDARPLILAAQKGNIQLLLRSPVDSSIFNTVPFKAEHFKAKGE